MIRWISNLISCVPYAENRKIVRTVRKRFFKTVP